MAAENAGSGQQTDAAIPASFTPTQAATSDCGRRRKQVKPPRVLLSVKDSAALREKLISELKEFTTSDDLTLWAQRILALKNQLTTSDAQAVERAFAAKLDELGDDAALLVKPEVVVRAEVGSDGEPTTANGGTCSESEPVLANEKRSPSRKLNGSRVPRRAATRENGSVERVASAAAAQQPVTPLSKPLRLRDRDHLKFVSAQPCLACGRSPSDAHHLRFAQQRALGREVSDEFTVPLCRAHHRELHRRGDELTWWQQRNVDPLRMAQILWQQTRPNAPPGDESAEHRLGV